MINDPSDIDRDQFITKIKPPDFLVNKIRRFETQVKIFWVISTRIWISYLGVQGLTHNRRWLKFPRVFILFYRLNARDIPNDYVRFTIPMSPFILSHFLCLSLDRHKDNKTSDGYLSKDEMH